MDDAGDTLDMNKLRETFKGEAYELLAELEDALISLEGDPEDSTLIDRVFRALHTIKGSGGACGFDAISRFAHDVESVFDAVRTGKMRVTKEIIDLTLSARDEIHALFEEFYGKKPSDAARTSEIAGRLRRLLPEGPQDRRTGPRLSHVPPANGSPDLRPQATFRIRFRPPQDIFLTGTNPLHLLDELRALGPCRVVAQVSGIPRLEEMNPELCYTYWDVILTTDRGVDAVKDVFIFVQDASDIRIERIDGEGGSPGEAEYMRLGDILVERGDLTAEDIRTAIASRKRVGEILMEKRLVSPDTVEAALSEQRHVRELRKQRQRADESASVRVHAYKLDKLVDLVGELVTVQARLTQTASNGGNALLLSIAEEVERLTAELRDNTMSIRMLPIGTIFNKFKRLVRDLSQNLGKDVELVAEGAETELDKTVIERLHDPLVHLIRNSIDHGIEPSGEREAAGKPRQGTVRLSAVHSGAHVLIRIQDDGKGIDAEAIRAAAEERGLIAPGATLTEKDQYALIFAPGFSTAKAVSDVSGRGVGMDVVKQAIDSLRGTVEIASEQGKGATITLSLPLTLAIIDGFLTRIGGDHFVFPLSLVDECVELESAQTGGSDLLNIRGDVVPFIRLRDRFGINGGGPAHEQVVITKTGTAKVGFVVDHVLGGHQTVIKNLGAMYKNADGVSGATILGDGSVALILDVPKLVQSVEQEEVHP
jgi:two-component system chemotaxis sensor kinase CheA